MKHPKIYALSGIYALLGAALLLAACDPTSPIFDTYHPQQARINRLTVDWSNYTGEIPSAYSIHIGDWSATLSGNVNTIDHVIVPGDYSIYLYNESADITVSGTTATVRQTGTATRVGEPQLPALPYWLYTSHQEATFEADTDYDLQIQMTQQLRQLTLTLDISPAVEPTAISAMLYGAAGSMDFVAESYGTPSVVPMAFVRQADGTWSATARLLGFVTDTGDLFAPLHGEIILANGYRIPFESNLSEQLTGFNSQKAQPLTLYSLIELTSTEAGFSATITPWRNTPVGSGQAD
jgi:hypothetical protein